jgi:hypothetical protein
VSVVGCQLKTLDARFVCSPSKTSFEKSCSAPLSKLSFETETAPKKIHWLRHILFFESH